MAKTCDVCGKPSGMYPLCRDCFKLRDAGKVVKDDKSGKWIMVEEKKSVMKNIVGAATKIAKAVVSQPEPKGDGTCIICGKEAPKGLLCIDCYKKKESEKVEYVGKRTKQEAMDHYFNQRNCVYKIKTQIIWKTAHFVWWR